MPSQPLQNRAHQRKGAISNAHVGSDFERIAITVLAREGIVTAPNLPISLGLEGRTAKMHRFDLGSTAPPVAVECKSHRWTEGDKVPSAKMTTWNEAMYYFSLVPNGTRKILFVLHDKRRSSGESLVSYYIRTYSHLIPSGVEIWEYCEQAKCHQIHTP